MTRARFATVAVVTLDAGGTLLRPHPSVGTVYAEVARRHARDYPAEELDHAFRETFPGVTRNPRAGDPEERERDFWRRVVQATLQRAHAPPPENFEAFFAELWDAFGRGARWRAYPHAETTLRELRTRGYRLGLISNADARLHQVLADLGWRDLFDAIVISSEAGAEKPDGAIFRAAAGRLASTPAHALHVGDSRTHDLDGARAAGWQALLVRHDTQPCREDEINSLADLMRLLPGS